MEAFQLALGQLWTFQALMLLSLGCGVALILGMLPGLSSTEAMIILLPVTYTLGLNDSMILLSAAYASAFVGAALTSIVFGIPGSSTGLATMIDGYPLNRKGQALYAVSAASYSSALAGLLSLALVVVLMPFMGPLTLLLGPPEWCLFVLLGLVVLSFSGESVFIKGLISAALGLLLGVVGLSVISGLPRFTFGSPSLSAGVPIIAAFVGLYPLTEAVEMVLTRKTGGVAEGNEASIDRSSSRQQMREGALDTFRYSPHWVAGGIVGWVVGVIPGVGGILANMMGYLTVKRLVGRRGCFGEGDIRGVIGSESANNGSVGGALIPALALGIPGSLNTAILLGVFMINGVQPGTNVFVENVDVTWLILLSTAIATLVASAIVVLGGWRFVGALKLLKPVYVAPSVIVIGLLAVLLANNNPNDVWIALTLAALGLAMKRYGYSRICLVIALMLSPLLESSFFQAMAVGRGSPTIFFNSWISIGLWVVILVCIGAGVVGAIKRAVSNYRGHHAA